MDWDNVTKDLKAPLDAAAVKPPPQGKYGEYVEALHVIREANRIFGFDGWSYDVKQLTQTNSGEVNGTYRVGYLAIVEVNIDGVTRADVGHGQGFTKQGQGDAHDSAVKEAVTDGLKRALRTFGNTFGLALYEKDKSAREVEDVGANERAAQHDLACQQAMDEIGVMGSLSDLANLWKGLAHKSPSVARDVRVVAAKDERKHDLSMKEEA